MRVLFLLAGTEVSGSETYCVSLEKAWGAEHSVFWVAPQLHFGQTYLSLPVHEKSHWKRFQTIRRLVQFIREHQIQIIHSHARRANWAASIAAKWTGIAHVSTIHQPLPVHLSSLITPCLGDAIISIDEVVSEHLQTHFKVNPRRITLIRNGVDLERLASFTAPAPSVPPRVVLLGRLSGGRWKVFLFVMEMLRRVGATLPQTQFEIAGEIPAEHASELASIVNQTIPHLGPSTLQTVGWKQDLPSYLRGVSGVIGAGRSAIESLAMGIPVLAFGEKGVLGEVNAETWSRCLSTNFGDHLTSPEMIPARFEVALRDLLSQKKSPQDWVRAQLQKEYALPLVAQKISALYQKL